jgi:hypothetical protein
VASPQEEQGILGAFGSIMDFSRSWAGGMVPFGMGGLNSGGSGVPQAVPQQQGPIDQGLLDAAQAAQQGILGQTGTLAEDVASPIGGRQSRIQSLLAAEVEEDEDKKATIAELTAQEWDTVPLYKSGDKVRWEEISSEPYKAAYKSAIMTSIPEGQNQNAIWRRAAPSFLYAFGAHILSNLRVDPKDMPSFSSSIQNGKVRLPTDLTWHKDILASASADKKSGKDVDEWKRENVALLAGLSENTKDKIFFTVQDNQQEKAIIHALEGITGQGAMGAPAYENLAHWIKQIDEEPIMTGKMPGPEGYIYRRINRAAERDPSSPMVYSRPGFPRVRLGGPGVEATGFPGPQSSI